MASFITPCGYSALITLICAGGMALVYITIKLVTARLAFYQKVRQGLPMPRWNPIFGHLLILRDLFRGTLPSDIARTEIFSYLCRESGELDSPLYVDLWPFIPPLLIVSSPNYATQVIEQNELRRPEVLQSFLYPMVGGNSIFTTNGAQWHHGRSLFLPWYTNNRVMDMTAKIVQQAGVFVQILRGNAESGRTFLFNEATSAYTMDISADVILNEHLECQLKSHPFASAMMSNMAWHYTGDIRTRWIRWSPLLPLLSWHNGRKMDQYISAVIDRRCDTRSHSPTREKSSETVLDFSLSQYFEKLCDGPGIRPDTKFKRWLTAELRLLMFTGHSSSAPTISYCHYLLSQNPTSMAKLRAEHTQVYGPDPNSAAQRICDQPFSLNQLPYTTAVIKETLRLFPPASSFREGAKGVFLHDKRRARQFPTERTHIWVIHSSLHRDPTIWVDAGSFLPERWLVGPDDPLYAAKGSFRPFERGRRDCLGQKLAMHSLRITMVMTARLFDFQAAYDQVDRKGSANTEGVKALGGERAYPIGTGGAQPAGGMPCKLTLRA